MTESEFRAWINANIKTNNSRSITGAMMNEFGQKCINFFAHMDNPIFPYSTTIENNDLVDLAITITHNKGTYLPDFIMFDENGNAIFSEYFTAHVNDKDNITFTFNDIIPATGNGYYKLLIWSAGILNVTPRFTEIFSSDFSSWNEGIPDDFIIEKTIGNPVLENDANRAKISGTAPWRIKLQPDIITEINREYRITINLIQGRITLNSGINHANISAIGINTVSLFAGNTNIYIQANNNTTIIDDLKIEEAA